MRFVVVCVHHIGVFTLSTTAKPTSPYPRTHRMELLVLLDYKLISFLGAPPTVTKLKPSNKGVMKVIGVVAVRLKIVLHITSEILAYKNSDRMWSTRSFWDWLLELWHYCNFYSICWNGDETRIEQVQAIPSIIIIACYHAPVESLVTIVRVFCLGVYFRERYGTAILWLEADKLFTMLVYPCAHNITRCTVWWTIRL